VDKSVGINVRERPRIKYKSKGNRGNGRDKGKKVAGRKKHKRINTKVRGETFKNINSDQQS